MKKRYSVDEVFKNGGESIGYAIFDEYVGDYIAGSLYSEKWAAQDDCDDMNEEYEASL